MKKIVAFFLAAICVIGVAGCTSEDSSDLSPTTAENMQSAESDDTAEEKPWSKQEILSMFTNTKAAHWSVIDCVPMPDHAYDRIGVVLFWDNEKETTNFAFMDVDGAYQMCGVYAKTTSNPELAYLGNATVTVQLEAENGSAYNYKLTFSADGKNVNFSAEDDLPKQ